MIRDLATERQIYCPIAGLPFSSCVFMEVMSHSLWTDKSALSLLLTLAGSPGVFVDF